MNDFTTMAPETERAFTAWSQPQSAPQRPAPMADIAPEPPTPEESEITRVADAFQAGREEAEAAHAEAIEELKSATATLQAALQDVERIRGEAMAQQASLVAEMITSVTRRVLGASIALHPDALPHLVRRTVEQMPAREGLTVSVPAAQAERIQRSIGAELGVHIIPDINLHEGCVVRSEGVHIESTLDSVMEGVEAAVADWKKQQPPTLDTLSNS